jgi:hypothetical protein
MSESIPTESINEQQQKKLQQWEALKEKWNRYYKENRERILQRKKGKREAKKQRLQETLGGEKQETRGRKPKKIDLEKMDTMKCLQEKHVYKTSTEEDSK